MLKEILAQGNRLRQTQKACEEGQAHNGLTPRVDAADFEVLAQIAQESEATQARRLALRAKLNLDQ